MAADRVRYGLRLCLARPAEEEQVHVLLRLFESERTHYQQDREAARQLATDPLGPAPADVDLADLAAWTVVANMLLNLDAVLTKG